MSALPPIAIGIATSRAVAKCQEQTISIARFTLQTMGGLLSMGMKLVIDRVHIVPMGMANAYLIESDGGLTLIDAGFPNKQAALFEAIRGLACSPDQLQHLVFTHGHPDHIGSAAAIVQETGA